MPSHLQSCLGHINRDYQRTREWRSLVQQRASCKLTLIHKENQRQTETHFCCKKLKSEATGTKGAASALQTVGVGLRALQMLLVPIPKCMVSPLNLNVPDWKVFCTPGHH